MVLPSDSKRLLLRYSDSECPIINRPPSQRDTLGGRPPIAEDAYAAYEVSSTQEDNVTVQYRHNWGVDTNFTAGVGEREGSHFFASVDASYGNNFENTTTELSSLQYKSSVTAGTDDVRR